MGSSPCIGVIEQLFTISETRDSRRAGSGRVEITADCVTLSHSTDDDGGGYEANEWRLIKKMLRAIRT